VTLEVPAGGRDRAFRTQQRRGQTTLVNVLTGFQPASSGAIFLEGVDVSRLKPHKLRRLGIARIFQGGCHHGRGRSGTRSA
jgi:branched-chain amino acid transport system ATP-binding protein